MEMINLMYHQIKEFGNIMLRYHPKKLSYLVALVAMGLLVSLSYSVYSSSLASPPIRSTFIQIYRHHESWSAERWSRLFEYLKTLRIKEVVIQWTVYDDAIFHPNETGAGQTLDQLMSLASGSGIKVWLGLVYDPHFWTKINRDPALVEVYLRRLRFRSEETARILAAHYPTLHGWYLATEIDDQHWQGFPARQILFQHLKDVTAFLHQLTPGKRVAISGFSNALLDPQTLEHFWRELLQNSNIDTVFFQDGIGAQKQRFSSLPLFLRAMERATQREGRRLGIVIELFQQVRAEPFQASSASWERLLEQIAIAQRFTPDNILAFSIPDYMSPLGSPEAEQLYLQYLKTFVRPGPIETSKQCPGSGQE